MAFLLSPGRCCCGKAECCCNYCSGKAWCCLELKLSGFANFDPATNEDICWQCGDLNGTILLTRATKNHETCIWEGSFCEVSEEDATEAYDRCGVTHVRAYIERTGTAGNFSYELKVELGHVPFGTWVTLVEWSYSFGNLGSELVECDKLFKAGLTCTLQSNSLDCEDPDDCLIKAYTRACNGLGDWQDDCIYCENVSFDPPWWARFDITPDNLAPRILNVSFTGVGHEELCPEDCDDICDDPDCDCPEPTCNDASFCDCVGFCNAVGWDSPDCDACWSACDPEYPGGCYAEWTAHFDCLETPEYIACQAACDECQECEDCEQCTEFNTAEWRLEGGGDAGTDTCFWEWQGTTACPGICPDNMDINRMRFEFTNTGNDLIATLYLRDGVTNIVSFQKTICVGCITGFGFNSTFDCFSWLGEAGGWSITIHDEDVNLCDWSNYALSITPQAYRIPCVQRPSFCPCDLGTPNGLPRYMLLSIEDHWFCGTSCPDPCKCNAAVGDFLLEHDPSSGSCRWRYDFDAPDRCVGSNDPECTTPEDCFCCWEFLFVTLTDTGTHIQLDVTAGGGNHSVSWRIEIPHKYPDGANVIDCFGAINDLSVPYCRQGGIPPSTSMNHICRWNDDNINLGDCRPAAGPAVTVTAIADGEI